MSSKPRSKIVKLHYNPQAYKKKSTFVFHSSAHRHSRPASAHSKNKAIIALDSFKLSLDNSANNALAESIWINNANKVADTIHSYKKLLQIVRLQLQLTSQTNIRNSQSSQSSQNSPNYELSNLNNCVDPRTSEILQQDSTVNSTNSQVVGIVKNE